MRRFVMAGCAAALLLAGCGSGKQPESRSGRGRTPGVSPVVLRDVGVRFAPPIRWNADRVVVRELDPDTAAVELSGAARGATFDYKAEQPGHQNKSLLRILVFDRSRWRAHLAEGGVPAGEPIDSVGNWVYVASLPQSNPYRDETLDADQFEDMHLTIDEVRAAFAVEGRGPALARR